MRTIKSLLAGLVAGSLAVVMASSAFAAKGEYNHETGIATVSGYTTNAGEQYTVVIVKDSVWTEIEAGNSFNEEDIYYINQFDGSETVLTDGMGTKTVLTMDQDAETGKDVVTTYKALIGGENLAEIVVVDITLTPAADPEEPPVVTYKFADVNEDGAVDASDVTRLLRHTTRVELLSYQSEETKLKAICDVNKDDEVNASDVTRLLRHTTRVEILEGVE